MVTGGAGFIGSHLCEYLLMRGLDVLCVDNFCDFYAPEFKRQNISSSLKDPHFRLVEADICDQKKLDKILAEEQIDMIVHLAAMAGVRPSIANPELYVQVNINGTVNLLQACVKRGIKHFVFASSSSVYGNNEKVPFAETDNVDFPISPYAATKKAGELLCHNWHHLYNISFACLRFFTVYGPRQRPDLAINKFCRLIMENKAIPVFGDGSTSRDYTYISDIIDGIYRSMEYIESKPVYEIFNLGESETHSLTKMIETIEQTLHKTAIKEPHPMQAGDVNRTFADIGKARKLLGYNPHTPFEEGVSDFVKWMKS